MKAVQFIIIMFGLWAYWPASAHAANDRPATQNHEAIITSVQNFIFEHIDEQYSRRPKVKVQHPDARLRLAACTQALEVFLPNHAKLIGKTTLGVRCPAPKRWTLYVTAQIRVYDKIAVAATPLSRGDTVESADVRMTDYDISRLSHGYYTSADEVKGLILKRTLSSGTPLSPTMLVEPKLVKRGQTVTLLVDSAVLQIRASGTALSDGRKGERIRVRNERSKQIVEGIVTAAGTVEFPL